MYTVKHITQLLNDEIRVFTLCGNNVLLPNLVKMYSYKVFYNPPVLNLVAPEQTHRTCVVYSILRFTQFYQNQIDWELLPIMAQLSLVYVLGRYLPSTLTSPHNTVNLFHQTISKSICMRLLNNAAGFLVSASRQIFLARNCVEWTHN